MEDSQEDECQPGVPPPGKVPGSLLANVCRARAYLSSSYAFLAFSRQASMLAGEGVADRCPELVLSPPGASERTAMSVILTVVEMLDAARFSGPLPAPAVTLGPAPDVLPAGSFRQPYPLPLRLV